MRFSCAQTFSIIEKTLTKPAMWCFRTIFWAKKWIFFNKHFFFKFLQFLLGGLGPWEQDSRYPAILHTNLNPAWAIAAIRFGRGTLHYVKMYTLLWVSRTYCSSIQFSVCTFFCAAITADIHWADLPSASVVRNLTGICWSL